MLDMSPLCYSNIDLVRGGGVKRFGGVGGDRND